jgi:hypothetical protein
LADGLVNALRGPRQQGGLRRRLCHTMFERHWQRRLCGKHTDGGEQRGRRENIQQYEQGNGQLEPLSTAPGWIVKDLPIIHEFALNRRPRGRQ